MDCGKLQRKVGKEESSFSEEKEAKRLLVLEGLLACTLAHVSGHGVIALLHDRRKHEGMVTAMSTDHDSRVRDLAYQLWEADGRPDHAGETYWHRAEERLRQQQSSQDKAVEDSFPASDPPSSTGITGPRKRKT